MAHKKAGGSSKNGRDSAGRRLGVKRFGGEYRSAPAISLSASAARNGMPARMSAWAETIRCLPYRRRGRVQGQARREGLRLGAPGTAGPVARGAHIPAPRAVAGRPEGDGSPSPFFVSLEPEITMSRRLKRAASLAAARARDIERIAPLAEQFRGRRAMSRLPYPYTDADAWRSSSGGARRAAGTDYAFAIVCERACSSAWCGLHPRLGGWEFGYWLGEPYWGNGYATEAGRRAPFRLRNPWPCHVSRRAISTTIRPPAACWKNSAFAILESAMRKCLARGCEVESREMMLEAQDRTRR